MTTKRQAFRTALLLTCSTLSLTALSPWASAQELPAVANPQAATATADDPQPTLKSDRDRDQAEEKETQPDASELARPKVWLGIGLKEISGDLAAYLRSTKGVLVESVFPDSPAEAAGIKVGDIIIELNGQRVADPRALIEALLKLDRSRPGDAAREDRDQRRRKDTGQKEGAERKDGAEQNEDAAQKEGAAQKEKEGENRDDDQQRDSAKKRGAYPPVKLTLLRQGKEITVEVTPTERPESLAMPEASVELPPGAEIAELNRRELGKLLQELERQDGARLFRFGPPSPLGGPALGPAGESIADWVILVKDASGKATEVRIQRVGDEPPKITVREGEKTREVSEEEIDQLPENVRDAVRQALKTQEQARSAERSRRSAARQRIEAELRERIQGLEGNRRGRDQLRERPEGQITIFSPEELRRLGQSAQELAAKYQQMAEDMAKRGVEKAQDLAAVPDELKELRQQVDELKKQVEELQKQIIESRK